MPETITPSTAVENDFRWVNEMKPESLKLVRVTLFVENLETQTSFYRDKLNLPPVDVRAGWSEFGFTEVKGANRG